MFQGFKQFMLRGNVLDLAVAVVMGAAFGAVVTALVKDLITPLIAAIIGKPDFSAIQFTVNGSKFLIGDFINAVVSFLLIGAAVYFFIVLPSNQLLPRMRRGGPAAPNQPPRNARNVSAMYRSQHAAARSARPRSPNPRSVLVPAELHAILARGGAGTRQANPFDRPGPACQPRSRRPPGLPIKRRRDP